MSNWSTHQFTRKGEQLRAKVEAGKCKLTLTKIKIGNGNVTLGEVKDMNDLKSPQLVIGISSCDVSAEDDRICEVVGIASSNNVESAFSVTEMGLFASDPDAGEILYLVGIDTAPDDMPNKNAQSPVTLTYQFELATSNMANVVAMISPAGLVTVKMMNAHRTAAELDHPDGSVLKRHLGFEVYGKNEVNDLLDTKVNKSGDTMTGNLRFSGANVGLTAADSYITFNGTDTGDAITGNGGANVNIGSWFGIGFYSTYGKRYTGTMDLRSGDWRTLGSMTADTFYTSNWFRARGDCGFFFEDHGGGWNMIDNEWIRAYNGKSIYTSGKIRCDAGFEGTLRGTADNANIAQHVANDAANMRMHWSGQGGQPAWLWGGNDPHNMYVWNPANFRVANANTVGDKSLQWILEQIENSIVKIAILTGTVAHGGTIPLPNGFLESQCKWTVSPAYIRDFATDDDLHNFSCTVDEHRKVSCLAENKGDTTGANTLANYIVIGVK